MANKSSNENLYKASQAKKDEFYTQLAVMLDDRLGGGNYVMILV